MEHTSRFENQTRHFDNDWLTVLAMLVIFFFHCARFFNFEDWHVKNNQLHEGLSVFVAILAQWIMPLFFILSGISSHLSLQSRATDQYLENRFRRLVIPLLFGTFILLIPAQVWIERVSHAQFEGTFWEFYPRYFDGWYGFGGNFAWMGLHLWYLEMLFVFSVITLPLFLFLKKERIQRQISGTTGLLAKSGAIFLPALLLFLIECLINLQPKGVGLRAFGGWSPFSYLFFFIAGFMLSSHRRYRETMARVWFVSLVSGFLTTSLMFIFPIDLTPFGDFVKYCLTIFCRAFNSWFWLVAFLGFGSKYLNFNHAVLKYAREAVLPFYILHQTAIVIVGHYLSNWEQKVMLKYLALSTFSFISIFAVYELLIKRIKIFRFIFGMKI
jgi:hypothetical protein